MAYYTYSGFGAGLGAGPFQVSAGVQPQHLRAAIAAIREQVERVHSGGVEAAELADARDAAVNSMPQALESNEGLAGMLHRIELFDLGADYPERHRELLEAVTLEQVAAAARELLHPDRLAVAAAGPVTASVES